MLFNFEYLLDTVKQEFILLKPTNPHVVLWKVTWPNSIMLLGGCFYCSHKPLQTYLVTEVVATDCPNTKWFIEARSSIMTSQGVPWGQVCRHPLKSMHYLKTLEAWTNHIHGVLVLCIFRACEFHLNNTPRGKSGASTPTGALGLEEKQHKEHETQDPSDSEGHWKHISTLSL